VLAGDVFSGSLSLMRTPDGRQFGQSLPSFVREAAENLLTFI
jgi:hypothetical protein